ncbi:predicted protein [Phaeodactylum tricornutum CCAP 1055/1]|jgi:hypothetical protein|uniref:Vesicle transport protein n=2 Tax=Phaeodactylum tricornutum TaxID=2850 RepID=B7FQ40_PHATC|nr:predicted protein [Phaeodactylum tricornutum CCAP 1055/1]EEC51277.1 predicted protein [Phaeodactylum tricornutum CCAP 1055/1]|eukprot:XP_002176814.1 predicted protein [Phaeodactylum tricornutum CCAP 1055/1]
MASFFQDSLNKAKLSFVRADPGDDVEEQQPDRLEELAEYCPTLTFQQRLIGFAVCFGMGYVMSFFSFRFFIKLIEGHPLPFAFNYTAGQIMQLLASVFLCGPKRQFKSMFDEKRRETSITYLSCLGATMVVIFVPMPALPKLILLLLLTVTQFCASLWYTLSYIPYGRKTALRMIKNALGIDESSYAGILGSTTT